MVGVRIDIFFFFVFFVVLIYIFEKILWGEVVEVF